MELKSTSYFLVSDMDYVGLMFHGEVKDFFKITCPCGITASYPINGFPTVDTPHPCGKKNHWVVKYEKEVTK